MPISHLDFGTKVLPVDDALSAAERGELDGWTYELLAALLDVQQDRGDRISTTTLTTKCPRSEWLQRKEPFTVNPYDLWPAFWGTMFHGRLEWNAHPRNIAEARYYAVLSGLGLITGSPDLVDPYRGVLYDYKTNKENPRYAKPWPDHVLQVQINRWIVDHAHQVEYDGQFFDLTDAQTSETFRPMPHIQGGWEKLVLVYMDQKGPLPLTVTRSEEAIGTTTGRPKKVRVPDIWSDDVVEGHIRRLYSERQYQLEGNHLPHIPPGFEQQEHVLCGYCPVRKRCKELDRVELLGGHDSFQIASPQSSTTAELASSSA